MSGTFDVKKISDKMDTELKNYNTLKDYFQKIHKQENNLYTTRKKALDQISKLQDQNEFLASIYSNFSIDLLELEKTRESTIISNLNNYIIPVTSYYNSEIKRFKQTISNYQSTKKKLEKQQISSGQLTQLNQEENQILENLSNFELNRIENNKAMILRYIHGELSYHTKAFEQLGELYKKLSDIYPCDNMKKFVELQKLQINNLQEFGYDERKINKRNKMKNRENEMERNSYMDDRSGASRVFERGSYNEGMKSNDTNRMQERSQERDDLNRNEIEHEI